MRITFVTAGVDYSGGFRVIVAHAERLVRRGHDVLIVTRPRHDPPLIRSMLSLARRGSLPVPELPPSHLDGKAVPVHILPRRRPVLARDLPDADVVVATWWETAEWVGSLSASKGAKAYFIQHHEVFDYLPTDRVTATYRLPMSKIVVSRWLQQVMRERYADEQAALVPNSVDLELFRCSARARGYPLTVGMVFSNTPWKASDAAVRAIQAARQVLPDLRVVAFGTDHPRHPHSLPVGTAFHVSPSQDVIRHIYSTCDAWICSSQVEGFALPPLEAMACGCPVVSTAVGGLTDVIRDGENGFLVAPGDEFGLADRLVRILQMPIANWERMSEHAVQSVSNYTWDDASARMEEILHSIARNSGR